MISGVQSIVFTSPVSTISPTAAQANTKLPLENTLALVQILEKSNAGYKMLVDGKIFQSNLPFPAQEQEVFLAKVVSTKPFTLQADNLVTANHLGSGVVFGLLKKLGLAENDRNALVLETLLKKKKAIIKSQFEKIENIVDSKNKIDDLQAALLCGLYFAPPAEAEGFKSEGKTLFNRPIIQIIEEIFAEITNYLSIHSNRDTNLAELLKVVFLEKERDSLRKIQKYFDFVEMVTNQKNRFMFLLSGEENIIGSKIANLITEYMIQKAVYNRFGVFPDFIISSAYSGCALSVFNHSRELGSSKVFISCDLQKNLGSGAVSLRGTLEGKMARLVCYSKSIAGAVDLFLKKIVLNTKEIGLQISVTAQKHENAAGRISAISTVNRRV